jgi:site-specific recombinase XerD
MRNITITGQYERAMRRRYLSPGTIAARMSAVRRWLKHAGAGWSTATADDIEEWLDRRDLAASSRYCQISHLSQFYRWAIRHGHAVADPCADIERPRLPRRLPRPARGDLVDQAIRSAPADVAIMCTLMIDAGLRCCEVARLDWSDVDLDGGLMSFTGKGGRDRVVGIPARLAATLARSDEVAGPVVGRTVTACRVSQIVNGHLRRCGVGATAHQLRHRYATRMLEATGGNLLAVQQALGHASVTSTQIYAQVDPRSALDAARALA